MYFLSADARQKCISNISVTVFFCINKFFFLEATQCNNSSLKMVDIVNDIFCNSYILIRSIDTLIRSIETVALSECVSEADGGAWSEYCKHIRVTSSHFFMYSYCKELWNISNVTLQLVWYGAVELKLPDGVTLLWIFFLNQPNQSLYIYMYTIV